MKKKVNIFLAIIILLSLYIMIYSCFELVHFIKAIQSANGIFDPEVRQDFLNNCSKEIIKYASFFVASITTICFTTIISIWQNKTELIVLKNKLGNKFSSAVRKQAKLEKLKAKVDALEKDNTKDGN